VILKIGWYTSKRKVSLMLMVGGGTMVISPVHLTLLLAKLDGMT
jgi:hypothetical protein